MKILEAFGEPISYGGQEAFVMNMLDHMDRSGMSFDMLTPYYCDNASAERRIREYGGRVFALGCRFRPGGLRLNTARPISEFLRGSGYDVIHIHSGSSSMLAIYSRLAAKAGIKRIIAHSHCTGLSGPKHNAIKKLTEGTLRRCPTDYCACSPEAGEWRFPPDVCGSRLVIINNGIDADAFAFDAAAREGIRERLGTGDEVTLIICVGRLCLQKNQSFLLELMRDIADAAGVGARYKLLLVGGGDDEALLRRRAEELGISRDVIFTGAVSDPAAYYMAADVMAAPSLYEGLGIAVIEGQAAGLEVTASDRFPGIAAVTDGIKFLPLDDKEAWIGRLTAGHARRPERCAQVAESDFNAELCAEKLRGLYTDGTV